MKTASRLRIVLVGPIYEGNVGAVARVAANFGVDELKVVAPQCDWRGKEAWRFAKGAAKDVLSEASETPELATALRGCTGAVAFTRRTGDGREANVELEGLAALMAAGGGPLGLVFGREDSGLTAQELAACTHVCTIPVAARMPSLNLSHAVAVAVARIFETAAAPATRHVGVGRTHARATVEEVHELFAHWEVAMRDVGLTRGGNPEKLLAKLRPALGRAALTAQEVAALRTYLSKTQVALGTRVNRSREPGKPD